MSEPGQGSEYELQPPTPPASAPVPPAEQTPGPKPGEPGWVPPVPIIEKAEPEPVEETVDPDVQRHKGIAILAYVFFVIPLVLAPNSKFARFHANQGLLVFILWCVAVIGTVVITVGWGMIGHLMDNVPILSFFFGCFAHIIPLLLMVGVIALTIMGIIHAANGEQKELPLLGHLSLIK